MSLNWSIKSVSNHEELLTKEHSGVTDTIVFATVFLGLPKITKKNLDEWIFRAAFHQQVFGNLLQGPSEDCLEQPEHVHHQKSCIASLPSTWEHLERRIGLESNAFPKFSRAAYLQRVARSFEEGLTRDLRLQRELKIGQVMG